jgi:hypothetical protein
MALPEMRIAEQNLSAGDLELEAREGESLMIMARGISGGAAGDVVEEYIREELMLSYQAHAGDDEVFPDQLTEDLHTDLLHWMREAGMSAPALKVPEGQDYVISNPAGNGTATVLYKEMSAGFVSGNEPGAPETKTRTFISSGQTTQSLAAGTTGTFALSDSLNPAQLADWPYEEDVAHNYEYDLMAASIELDAGSGANTSLDGIKMTTEEVDFLARDSAFVDPLLAQYVGPALDVHPLIFLDAPTFSPGDELDTTVQASNSGSGAEDAVINSSMIFHRRGV